MTPEQERDEVGQLADVLVELRRRAGLTQRQVAERMGWSEQRYSQYERRLIRKFPPPSTIEALASAVGVDPKEILQRVGYFRAVERHDPAYVFSAWRQDLADIDGLPEDVERILRDALDFGEQRWRDRQGP